MEDHEFITVFKIEEWRDWLEKNHIKEKKVGLISYKKHTGKGFISHRNAMEEAICFGWIDTTLKRLDDERFVRYFVKRGDKANWSENTLRYAKELLSAGRMSQQGKERFEEGLKKKPHDYGLPKKPDMPIELKRGLIEKKALKNFESFPPSAKYAFYRWLLRAKGEETQRKRIGIIVEKALKKDKNLI